MPVVDSAIKSGFFEREREERAERMLEMASPQRVCLDMVYWPIPEIIISTPWPFNVKGPLQSSIFRTSPVVIVRWVSMADWETPFERSMVVSLVGVRATVGGVLEGGLIYGGRGRGRGTNRLCRSTRR